MKMVQKRMLRIKLMYILAKTKIYKASNAGNVEEQENIFESCRATEPRGKVFGFVLFSDGKFVFS